jgi:hypothetical protein
LSLRGLNLKGGLDLFKRHPFRDDRRKSGWVPF